MVVFAVPVVVCRVWVRFCCHHLSVTVMAASLTLLVGCADYFKSRQGRGGREGGPVMGRRTTQLPYQWGASSGLLSRSKQARDTAGVVAVTSCDSCSRSVAGGRVFACGRRSSQDALPGHHMGQQGGETVTLSDANEWFPLRPVPPYSLRLATSGVT